GPPAHTPVLLAPAAGGRDVNGLAGNAGATLITAGDLDLDGSYVLNQPVSVPGGSLTLRGDWDNDGGITQSGGTVLLGGTFTVADLGAFPGTAGTVSIFGTLDDPGATLVVNADRAWQVSGGTLRGAPGARLTVDGEAGALLQVTSASATLDAVTLSVNTTLREGTTGTGNQVTVLNGLTLDNATLRLERPSTFAGVNTSPQRDVGLNFSGGAQLLGGTGVVEMFHGVDVNGGALEQNVRVRPTSGGSLTVGPGITVRNAAGSDLVVLGEPTLPLTLQGTASAQVSGRTLRLTGSTVTNTGTLQANLGTLDVRPTT